MGETYSGINPSNENLPYNEMTGFVHEQITNYRPLQIHEVAPRAYMPRKKKDKDSSTGD